MPDDRSPLISLPPRQVNARGPRLPRDQPELDWSLVNQTPNQQHLHQQLYLEVCLVTMSVFILV